MQKIVIEAAVNELYGNITLTLGDGEQVSNHLIPLDALASWSELLGIVDPGDALDAILYVTERGEPEPDPVTGENVWTASYQALQEREQAQAAEAIVAKIEGRGADPRSPLLRSKLVALPLADTVATAQATARQRLGLPEPGTQIMARTVSRGTLSPLDALKSSLATDFAGVIETAREGFLADLRPPIDQ